VTELKFILKCNFDSSENWARFCYLSVSRFESC